MNYQYRKRYAALMSIGLVAISVVTIIRTLPTPPLPEDAPASEFSAERAIKHIQIIAEEPHPTGSSANAAVRQYILAELKELGLETETQRDGDLENVMGRIVGSNSSDAVLLTAHLDSVAESPSATDDGSGVGVLLETARALMLEAPLQNTVIFLFTDFEEGGLVGAKSFIMDHPWAQDVRIVIGLDAGGLSGPGVLSATSPNNGWLIRQLVQADPYLSGSSAINALADSGTDFGHAFKPAGFSGYAFDLYWDRRIHTPDDNLENLNSSSLQHQGYHALSLARHFGNLDQLSDPREADAVYFSILRSFTIYYSSTWAFPIALAVTAIYYSLLRFGLSRRFLTWNGLRYGAFVLLVSLMIAPLPSLLLNWTAGMPFRFIGRSFDRPPQVTGVFLASLALIVLWYFLSRRIRSKSIFDLTLGALVPMWVAMVGASLLLPALSFAFTWPVLLSLLACANWFYWHQQHRNSHAVFLGLLLSGITSIIILGSTILLGLFDQMSLTLLLVAILCGFLLPQIHLILNILEDPQQANKIA